MPSYLVETFLSRGAAGERAARERRAHSAAEELTHKGTSVRLDRTIHVPEDEICFFVFDAPSREDAALAAQLAAVGPLRVVEAASSANDGRRRRELETGSTARKPRGGGMKRAVRWLLLSMGLTGVISVVAVAPGVATPPSALVNVPLARGTDVSDGTLPLQIGTDVAMAQITVAPGGSSGWHSHPGGAIIVVKTGTLTLYRALGSQCQVQDYSEGHMFIERPGEVDDVVNTGTVPYVLFVTFPRVPQGESARIDEPDPGTCPGL